MSKNPILRPLPRNGEGEKMSKNRHLGAFAPKCLFFDRFLLHWRRGIIRQNALMKD